jgi:hypothetical protein
VVDGAHFEVDQPGCEADVADGEAFLGHAIQSLVPSQVLPGSGKPDGEIAAAAGQLHPPGAPLEILVMLIANELQMSSEIGLSHRWEQDHSVLIALSPPS